MTNYRFMVIKYQRLNGECIVESKQIIPVLRTSQYSAEQYIKRKYPFLGGEYFVELYSTEPAK